MQCFDTFDISQQRQQQYIAHLTQCAWALANACCALPVQALLPLHCPLCRNLPVAAQCLQLEAPLPWAWQHCRMLHSPAHLLVLDRYGGLSLGQWQSQQAGQLHCWRQCCLRHPARTHQQLRLPRPLRALRCLRRLPWGCPMLGSRAASPASCQTSFPRAASPPL